jgi:hypothetical protein
MKRNSATQRRPSKALDPRTSTLDYFFRREKVPDGTALVPRTDFVTREELFWFGDWITKRLPARNRWYKKLWRFVTGSPVVTIDPFSLVASAHEPGKPPAPEPERPAPSKRIDATGNVVDP